MKVKFPEPVGQLFYTGFMPWIGFFQPEVGGAFDDDYIFHEANVVSSEQ